MNQIEEVSAQQAASLMERPLEKFLPGRITAVEPIPAGVRLRSETGVVMEIAACAENLFRLRVDAGGQEPWDTEEANGPYLVEKKEWEAPPASLSRDDHFVTLTTETHSLRASLRNFSLSLWDRQGNVLFSQPAHAFAFTLAWCELRFFSAESESFYGLGLRQSFPHNGRELHHTIQFNHWEGKSVPFFVSSGGYGLFLNETMWDTTFRFQNDEGWGRIRVPYENHLEFYLFAGSYPEILRRYSELTGMPILPPKWSFGYWHGKYGYRTQEETEEVVAKFRAKQIPLDLLFLDLHWRGAYSALELSSLEWDLDCFPEPRAMLRKINDQHVHVFGHMNTSCLPYARDFTNPSHIREWQKKVPPIKERCHKKT